MITTTYSLVEICKIRSGKRLPKGCDFSEAPTAYKYIRARDIKNGTIDGSDLVYISEEVQSKIKKYIVNTNDIVITIVGASVGDVAYVASEFDGMNLTENAVRLTEFAPYVNSKYLMYILNSLEYWELMQQIAGGAAQPKLGIYKIEAIKVHLPPKTVQDRIVDILCTYDDLIKNNQKKIKLLEEAAQRLYKEWFMDLRFPGHETTPIIDGIPEGWERKTVAECLSFHGNGGWGKETPMGKNEHPGKVIRGTDIEDVKAGRFGDIPLRYHTDNDIKKRTLKNYDLVFELSNGNINNIGRCLLIDDLVLKNCGENTICASFCKLLRPVDRLHSLMLYWEIQDMQISGRMLPLKKHGANGINNFDFDGFLNHELLIPNNADMLAPIEAIMTKICIIQGQFALLTESRDRLLPKLMNGEIEV